MGSYTQFVREGLAKILAGRHVAANHGAEDYTWEASDDAWKRSFRKNADDLLEEVTKLQDTDPDIITFHVRVNGGEEQTIQSPIGTYVSAVAAVPAILGITPDQFPLRIEIWVPCLLPGDGPYFHIIGEPGGPVLNERLKIGGVHFR